MSFDMRETIKPKSDQLNADDLIGGDLTINITAMKKDSNIDQPVAVHFQGDNGKPYKPCKGMRRIMVAAWGSDASQYVGKRMELFREPTVTYGKLSVGGIRISGMSSITNPNKSLMKDGNKYSIVLTSGRGKKILYEFEELLDSKEDPIEEVLTIISTAQDLDDLKKIWSGGYQSWKSKFKPVDFSKIEKRKEDKKTQLMTEVSDISEDIILNEVGEQ